MKAVEGVSQSFAEKYKVRPGERVDVAVTMPYKDAMRDFGVTSADEFFVYPAPGASRPKVKRELEKLTASQGRRLLESEFELSQLNTYLDSFSALLSVMIGSALAITSLGLANMMLVSAFERLRLIGVMRASGLTRRQLARVLAGESMVVGVLCLPPGLIIGNILGSAQVRVESLNAASSV